jgi:hypothetical protein
VRFLSQRTGAVTFKLIDECVALEPGGPRGLRTLDAFRRRIAGS